LEGNDVIAPSLEDVNEARLSELIGASESLTLEFKRELPQARLEQAKVELLKDVCAMANAAGGDILYGMDEREAVAAVLTPITEPFDAAERRMRQVLDAIEPRLNGLRFREVPLSSGGYAMVLRVPASYAGPHRFNSRFVLRDGTRSLDMTYDQLRAAFDRSASLTARALAFRDERVTRIERGDGFRNLEPGPLMVVHVLPLAGC
jgi:predicted HTH transcriptional regulator